MGTSEPKYNTRAERVRFAIRKKYLEDEEWTHQQIADELNVRPRVVSRYLNETPQAKEIEKARKGLEEIEWKELIVDLKRRLDRLRDLEDQLWDVVEPVITAYDYVSADAKIEDYHLQEGGNSLRLDLGDASDDDADDPPEAEVEIPIPARWEETPQFSRLKRVWKERRKTQDQLVRLLGLEAADELQLSGELTEQKVFSMEFDSYPDAAPHQVGDDPEDDAHEDGQGDNDQEDPPA